LGQITQFGYDDAALGDAFNLASGKETGVIDLAKAISDGAENPSDIEYRGRRDGDTHSRRRSSIEKANSIVGYGPSISLDDGLLCALDWFRTNNGVITSSARLASTVIVNCWAVHQLFNRDTYRENRQ